MCWTRQAESNTKTTSPLWQTCKVLGTLSQDCVNVHAHNKIAFSNFNSSQYNLESNDTTVTCHIGNDKVR